MKPNRDSKVTIGKKVKRTVAAVVTASLLVLLPEEASAGMKPIVQKVFQEFVNSLRHSSSNPRYPNLTILKVKVMPNGKIGIAIGHQGTPRKGRVGEYLSDFTIPFERFYRRTVIDIYRFDHKKERFARWEHHTLQQLDPMKSNIPIFYQKPGTNFSFVTDKTFQGKDYFVIVIESPQPESRYDDNRKLVVLTSPTHRLKRQPADLAIASVNVKTAGKYCYPVLRIVNHGGKISDKAWQGHGARLTLFFRSDPTQRWRVFDTKRFSEFDPGKKLQKSGGSIVYSVDRAIDQSYRFKVVIDAENNISESNEMNNQKERILTCNSHPLPLQQSDSMRGFQRGGGKKDKIEGPGLHSKHPFEVPQRVPRY